MQAQTNQTPMNIGLSITTMPQPQVVSGTVGESGVPLPPKPIFSQLSVDQVYDLSTTFYIGSFEMDTSVSSGTHLKTLSLPVMMAYDSTEPDLLVDHIQFLIKSHHYMDPMEFSLGYMTVAPEPIVGRVGIVYNPCEFRTIDTDSFFQFDRRAMMKEWNLGATKIDGIHIEGFKMDGRRTNTVGDFNASTPSPVDKDVLRYGWSWGLGSIEFYMIQRIQVPLLYTSMYTVHLFGSFGSSQLTTLVDPRMQDGQFTSEVTFTNANLNT